MSTRYSGSLSAVLVTVLAMSGCATGDGSAEYKSSGTRAPLDVPPDLVSPTSSTRYTVPAAGEKTTLSDYQRAQRKKDSSGGLSKKYSTVSLERSGQIRWLKVNLPAEVVWQQVREFWQETGFLISEESAETGVIQTDWAEKTAKISDGIIRDTLSRALGTRYATSERDAFRSRLEVVDGGTEIYLTHRGMEEVISESLDGQTRWQARPTDHQLEVEFLRRLMTYLGTSEEDSQAAVARAAQVADEFSEIVEQDGASVLRISEGFDRAWRRVGLALDRGSFTVEDRNRAEGTYFVRYIDSDRSKDKPGVFSRIFGGSKPEDLNAQYRIVVADAGQKAEVRVQGGKQGEGVANQATVRRMLSLIQGKLGQ